MKKNEITVGGVYVAKVSGKLTKVKVTAVRQRRGYGPNARETTVFDGVNQSTGRKVVGYTAAKFRYAAKSTMAKAIHREAEAAKQPSDPTPAASVSTSTSTKSTGRTASPALLPTSRSTQMNLMDLPIDTESIREAEYTKTERACREADEDKAVEDKAVRNKWTLADRIRKAHDTGVDTAPHVIVEARAGTGKTTTLIEGLKRVKGLPSTLVPSPQQAAVWEAMELSKGRAQTICFVAFNKSIANELKNRVPKGCDASTMHSLGGRAVVKTFNLSWNNCINSHRVQDIIAEILDRDIRELRRTKPKVIKATEEIVGLCKMNLVGVTIPGSDSHPNWDEPCYVEALSELASYYDVDLNGHQEEVFQLVPKVLERCKDVQRDGCIDYDDMVWLPIVLGLQVQKYDMLLVDEAQDLNRCQQALAKKAGRRLIFCGDPKQSIYGFAGADCESMARLEEELRATERGCLHLPLTVTRRCGKAIVAEAQKIVKDFAAFETNPEGKVDYASLKSESGPSGKPLPSYRQQAVSGDMVLCRCNAPLVSECFRFLKAGWKANIQGRDVGRGLISTVNKVLRIKDPAELSYHKVTELVGAMDGWLHKERSKENAKRNPSEQRLANLQDRVDCLACFCEGCDTAIQVVKKIEQVFTDDKQTSGIRLSSVHKAKGLEAKRVFILVPREAPMPNPMAKTDWEREQELNIKYVAITRAIEELVWVS